MPPRDHPDHERSARAAPRAVPRVRPSPRHIVIEAVAPMIDCGRSAVKRVAGDLVTVEADIFRDGHDLVRAVVRWRLARDGRASEAPMTAIGNDRWRGAFPVEKNDRYLYTIEAWTDHFGSWRAALAKKVAAGQDVASDVAEGVAMLEAGRGRAQGDDRRALEELAAALRAAARFPRVALAVAEEPALGALMARLDKRADAVAFEPELEVFADRERGLAGAWYEFFPRSEGTLRDAERRLPGIRDMGFDVVYLPPIHPIGVTNRKGRNNAPRAEPGDPGSPWAIGGPAGGHTAVEPSLGTIEDFDRFVEAARRHGLEVALDFAIQCSPDHPWVREHPDWFYRRPDGTIKTAENPPKKYEDVYTINFDTDDREALWQALLDVVKFWIAHGVSIFRVDNPHTKPIPFWRWLIREIQSERPDVVFLSEAFTRPKVMAALAKAGFTQSYTYFTWRNTKHELTEYMTELTRSRLQEYFRPNFFANTPDILPTFLQAGGRGAFALRLLLAATLSPSYGIYSGFELCENAAIPGREEYLDSEKYELKRRDWDAPGNIRELIARVNAIRRENPALRRLTNLRFLEADSPDVIAYAKVTPEPGRRIVDDPRNVLIVVVNLDPHHARECTVAVPAEAIGAAPGATYEVEDLLTGARYEWGERNYVRLDPAVQPGHVLRVVG